MVFANSSRVDRVTGMVGSLEVVIAHFTRTSGDSELLLVVPIILSYMFRCVPTFTLTRSVAKLLMLKRENSICDAGGEFLDHACRTGELSETISLQYCCNGAC